MLSSSNTARICRYHTGDAAVVHPDSHVEIRDRLKDVIISGGENISSVEVEGCLLRHPAVQEAAVVGMPHERWNRQDRGTAEPVGEALGLNARC